MKSLEIIGFKRANLDRRSLDAIREEGNVPCVVYGPGIKEQIHFVAPAILFRDLIYTPEVHMVDLNIEGTIIKTILSDKKAIKMEIPVKPYGSSPGIIKGGKLEIKTRTLLVKGFANDLPDEIPFDISTLELGKSVKVGDLSVEKFELLNSPNVTIATVGVPRALRGKKGDAEEEEG